MDLEMMNKIKVMEAALQEFNENNFKFTMDSIAKRIGMSKKTIYALFPDKETLFLDAVDYFFQMIKESEQLIYENNELDLLDKIQKILIALPENYANIDWRQIAILRDRFPTIYAKVQQRIENGWETTLELLQQAIEEGRIRPISLPIFKAIVEASIEHFIGSTSLLVNEIDYQTALDEMVSILIRGIKA